MTEEMINILDNLPEDLRSIIASKDEKGNYVINGDKFQDALDKSYPDEKNKIIELFFRELCEKQWKNIPWTKIEPILDVLQHICLELGFKEVDNPFLAFLKKYLANNSLTRDNMIDLNNMYAKDVITYEDLVGKGPFKDEHIIFNPTLYTSRDAERITKMFNFLNKFDNLKRINWQEIANANPNQVTSDVKSLASTLSTNPPTENDVDRIRDTILYINNSRELRQLTTLDYILKLGSTNANQASQEETKKSKEYSYDDIKKKVVDMITKSGLDISLQDELVRDVLSDLKNAGFNLQ